MKKSIWLALFFFLLSIGFSPQAQNMKSLEFKNQEIRDILIVLAQLNDVSILADETVQGKTSFYFANTDFKTALALFLEANGLYSWQKSGIFYVSRIWAVYEQEKFSIKATDVPIRSLISAMSTVAGKTILYDLLPTDPISIQADKLLMKEVLDILVAKYPNLVVSVKDTFYYVQRRDSPQANLKPQAGYIKLDKNLYSVSAEKARMRDVVLELFTKAGREIVFLMDQDIVLENLNYSNKTFDEMLRLLLLRVGGDFSISDSIYYILEIQKRDLQKKFLTTLILPLQHITIAELQRLMPSNLLNTASIKLDEKSNRVVLNGTLEEIRPTIDFISLVDSAKVGDITLRIDLSYLRSDEFLPLLPAEFAAYTPTPLPSKSGFIITLPESKVPRLKEMVAMIDAPNSAVPITLHYIKADELLANLPPSAPDQSVKKSSDPRIIFFRGTDAVRKVFLKDLSMLDRPKDQIKYQLLVLEVEDTSSDTWGSGLTTTFVDGTKQPGLQYSTTKAATNVATLKSALDFSFDIVSTFGLEFVANLSWKMSQNKASIIADTTLQALSGDKLTFKNTNTVRIKDNEQSTQGGVITNTAIVREISSGLLINIDGWVSGNRMVSMKIDTTLSKNTSDAGATNLPTTTEKSISTTVRTELGKPIEITGLKQQQRTDVLSKTPGLGDIPWVGMLFNDKKYVQNTTNYLIYIIPRIEAPEVNIEARERKLIESYYSYLSSGTNP